MSQPLQDLPTSTVEQVLNAVARAILAANTLAATRCERGRPNSYAVEELLQGPAVNIMRSQSAYETFGEGAHRSEAGFTLHLWALGPNWETVADQLHLQCHTALLASTEIKALGKGLRCTDADPQQRAGEHTMGVLAVQYRISTLVSRATLAALNPTAYL